jgi:hypothetical protein
MPIPSLTCLAPAELLHIERVSNEFEADWQSEATIPQLEGFLLEAANPVRPVLLAELLMVELGYRRRRGQLHSVRDRSSGCKASERIIGERGCVSAPRHSRR